MTRSVLTALACVALAFAAAAQKTTYNDYIVQLDQAIRLNDDKGVDRTIRDNPTHTIGHFRGLVLGDRNGTTGPNPQREVLKTAWKRTFESDTLDNVERWVELADDSTLRSNDNFISALAKAYGELDRLQTNHVEDRRSYEALRKSLMELAQAFESLGNRLEAADAWGVISRVDTIIPEQTLEDRRDGVFAIDRFIEHRTAWGFTKDDSFMGNQNWAKAERERIKVDAEAAEQRKAEGYSAEVKGAEAYLMPDSATTERTAELVFAAMDKPNEIGFSPRSGPVPMLWPSVNVVNQGPSEMLWFRGVKLYCVRDGSTKFGVTLEGLEPDLGKNPWTKVDAGNRIKKPSTFALDAEGKRPYAMWFYIGGSQETFMGYSQNLAPADEQSATVYYKSAASWTTDIDGTRIALFDDDGDGVIFEQDPFGDRFEDVNLGKGPDEKVMVPQFDAMQIGKGPVVPFSSWVKLADSWVHLREHANSTGVSVRTTNPAYFKTGSIEFEWTGPKPAQPVTLVVGGEGDFASAMFDIAGKDPVEVPVGRYKLLYGRIESGRGARMITANVFPGTMEPIEVKAGETARLTIGGPFRLDFNKEQAGGNVRIHSATIRVRGVAGELYTHINGAAPAPEVMVGKSEDGKGARAVGEFVAITDPELANQVASKVTQLGNQVGFYPVPKGSRDGNPVLEVAVPEGQLVGLSEKKNKLFGSLEPIYK